MSHKKAGKYSCYEFERKFLLLDLPKGLVDSQDYTIIEDKYYKETSLRLRTVTTNEGKVLDRKFTKKFVPEDSNLSITHITNLYLSETEASLLNQLPGSIIIKKRYKFKQENYDFSIDVFEGRHLGLVIAEIEFENEEQMKSFSNPFSDTKEITLDYKFSGGNLAFI